MKKPEDNRNVVAKCRKEMLENLNANIKKDFKKFKFIYAYPFFDIDGSYFVLSIENKKKFAIDSTHENKRSLGYKCFSRIYLEISSLSILKNDLFYLIDEPEQSLHPFLQQELMVEINKFIEKKENLTVFVATHSPYIISQHTDNNKKNIIHLVYRKESTKISGETFVEKFNENNIEKINDYFKNIKNKKII